MTRDRMKVALGVVATLIIYGGGALGLLLALFAAASMVGIEAPFARGASGVVGGLGIAMQAFVFGGALKLLVGIDDRLEKLERRG